MSKHPSVVKLEEKLNGQFASNVLYLEVYDRHQGYGGPEEGGWWYHTMHYTGTSVPIMGVLYDSHDHEDKERDDVEPPTCDGITFLKYYSTWDDEGYDYDYERKTKMVYLNYYDVKSRWPKALEIVETYFEDGELDDPDETFYMVDGQLACYCLVLDDEGYGNECFWNEDEQFWEDEDGCEIGTYDEECSKLDK